MITGVLIEDKSGESGGESGGGAALGVEVSPVCSSCHSIVFSVGVPGEGQTRDDGQEQRPAFLTFYVHRPRFAQCKRCHTLRSS